MKMGFTVIDRSQLDIILKEKSLDMAGFLESGNYNDIKNILNINAAIVGSIDNDWVAPYTSQGMSLGGYYTVNNHSIRIIDTETSEVLLTARCSFIPAASEAYEIILNIKSKLFPNK